MFTHRRYIIVDRIVQKGIHIHEWCECLCRPEDIRKRTTLCRRGAKGKQPGMDSGRITLLLSEFSFRLLVYAKLTMIQAVTDYLFIYIVGI